MIAVAVVCGLLLAPASATPAVPRDDRESNDGSPLEEICRVTLCRDHVTVKLRLPNGKTFEMATTTKAPVVTGGLVTILPGETITVEARVEGDRLVDLKAVPEVAHPESTLVFEFTQEPSIGDGTGMVLKATSPFPGVLKYRAGLMRPDSDRLLKTSVCPLHSGRPCFEHWPYPIFQFVATDFRFVDPRSEGANKCE